MIKAGIIGSPVAHSLSPQLHHAALNGLEIEYFRADVTAAQLDHFINSTDADYLSVTMPLKTLAAQKCVYLGSSAAQTGVVNILVRQPDKHSWHGYNTDVYGMVKAIELVIDNQNVNLVSHAAISNHTILLIGAGASAKSAVLALHSLGVRHANIVARKFRLNDAAELASSLGWQINKLDFPIYGMETLGSTENRAAEHKNEKFLSALKESSFLLSCLPAAVADEIGLYIQAQNNLSLKTTYPGKLLFDLAYYPQPRILNNWFAYISLNESGNYLVDPLAMLIFQAYRQVEIALSCKPALPAMFAAINKPFPSCLQGR